MGLTRSQGTQLAHGYELLLADPDLPAETPRCGSELFAGFGVFLRHGLATPLEHYLAMHQGPLHQHYGNDRGAVHIYAYGGPLALAAGQAASLRADADGLVLELSSDAEGGTAEISVSGSWLRMNVDN